LQGEFLEIIHISSFQAIMAEYSSMCCVDDNVLEFLTWNDLDPTPNLSLGYLKIMLGLGVYPAPRPLVSHDQITHGI